MKSIFSVCILLCLAFVACNDGANTANGQATPLDTTTTLVTDTAASGCYSLTRNRDTASLQFQKTGNTVMGSLSYNYFEKDRNDGTFQGELSNNIITGWYLFRSEGIMSVRQIIFKVENEQILPAIGNTMQRNDTMFFVNPSEVVFDSSQVFKKVNCVI